MTRPVLDDPQPSAALTAVNGARESKSELRAMVTLALPVVVAQVGLMAMGAVDTVMVGHISAHVLAAVMDGAIKVSGDALAKAGQEAIDNAAKGASNALNKAANDAAGKAAKGLNDFLNKK